MADGNSNEQAVIRAKMRVNNIAADTNPNGIDKDAERVTLVAAYSPDQTQENYKWSKATPQGNVQLTITNKEAMGQFQEGQYVFVDIIPLPADQQPVSTTEPDQSTVMTVPDETAKAQDSDKPSS